MYISGYLPNIAQIPEKDIVVNSFIYMVTAPREGGHLLSSDLPFSWTFTDQLATSIFAKIFVFSDPICLNFCAFFSLKNQPEKGMEIIKVNPR